MTQDASPAPGECGPGAPREAAARMPDAAVLPRPWLGSYPPGVPPTYRYPPVALPRFLDDAARDFPSAVAVRQDGATLDYAGLRERVERLAAALAGWGVGPGHVVAMALPNVASTPIVAFGAWRAGAVLLPLDHRLDAGVVHDRLARTGTRVLLATPEVAAALDRGGLPGLQHVVVSGRDDWRRRRWPPPRRRSRRRRRAALSLPAVLDRAAPTSRQPQLAPADLAVIQHTAGGHVPAHGRAVALSHANLVANSFQARLWVPDMRAGKERLLAALPFTHPYGLTQGLLTAVLAAAALELVERFDPGEVLTRIERRRPTLFPGTPEMYRALLEHPDAGRRDLRSLRACVSGGAGLPLDVARGLEDLTGGARVREGYGCTEASPLTHANPIYGRGHLGTIGLPVTDTVAAVVDVDEPTRLLATGAVGELAVHGPQVSSGYWTRPGAALATRDRTGREVLRDGWLLTGDLASQGPDGEFVLHGRRDGGGGPRKA